MRDCGLVALAVIGLSSATALGGCGGGTDIAWDIDPDIVARWDMNGLTEDGVPAYFEPRVIEYRADGTWRSDSAGGEWSRGTYRTGEGRLNYRINAASKPNVVGHEYTFDYHVAYGILTIEGRHLGHYYVSTFVDIGPG
jgi:hypothetical protein